MRQRGRDSGSAIAFGMGPQLDRFQPKERYDVVFRLQENRWNGVTSPQLVVRRIFDASRRYDGRLPRLAGYAMAGRRGRLDARGACGVRRALELADGAKRSLLESETFRALLDEAPVLAQAA